MTAASSTASPTIEVSPATLAWLSVVALTWAALLVIVHTMGNGIGTMDLGLGGFVGMWALMMTAMMLPAVAPVASLYARTIPAGQPRRWLLFVAGYLLVWASVGVPVYGVLRILDRVGSDTTVRVLAVIVLAAAGVYQLTPLKAVCLRHCRSPLGQLLHYGNVTGRFKELRVAAHHAAFCLGCCWMLMAIFLAFGVMNVWAMVGLAAVVVGEKMLRHGVVLGQAAGVVLLALAIGVAVSPRTASAVLPGAPAHMATSMTGM
jgi:predicted metal-binding membrane protein